MIKFAKRTEQMQSSEIRESYKLMGIPGMVSLAGGAPASDLYPVEGLKKASANVYDKYSETALSYSATEGYAPLREKIAERMAKTAGIKCGAGNIMLLSGSQQGLEMSAKIFVNEGDYIACETPSYMGAFNAFCPFIPNYESVPTDEYGMIPEELEKILARNDRVSMIYVIPNFQNPTGHTWTLERRRAFMDVVNKYEIPVIEDDPYGEIRFEGTPLPTLKSMDTKGLVVYLGSFSKILAPGYRVGWVCASDRIIEKYIFAKQGCDMQVTSIIPMIINEFMEMYDLDEHVAMICSAYKQKRDAMLRTMEACFPAGVKWSKPEGGLFVWVELPKEVKAKDVLDICVEKKVIFVTGKLFYPVDGAENTLRLNFSRMTEDVLVEGVKRMGEALHQVLGGK